MWSWVGGSRVWWETKGLGDKVTEDSLDLKRAGDFGHD